MPERKATHWAPYFGLYICHYPDSINDYARWRPKGSPDYLMIYTAGGAGRYTTDKGEFKTETGEAIFYSPHQTQDYRTDPEAGLWNHYWVHFQPKSQWQVWLNWPEVEQGLKFLRLEGEGRSKFEQALAEAHRLSLMPIPEALELAMNSLERALLWAHASVPGKKWLTRDTRVSRAMDYLRLRSAEPFEMEKLAAHCHLSPSRLAHLFRQETQTTPQHYLESHRMQQAATLLRITNRSVAEIASEVGYDDPFYFTNRFRRHAGRSPTLFRKLYSDGSEPQPGRPQA